MFVCACVCCFKKGLNSNLIMIVYKLYFMIVVVKIDVNVKILLYVVVLLP